MSLNGLFTMANSNSFLSPYQFLLKAKKKKYKQIFKGIFLLYDETEFCVYSLELPRGNSNEYTQHTITV